MKALDPIERVTIELASEIANSGNRLIHLKMGLGMGFSYAVVKTIGLLLKINWLNNFSETIIHGSGLPHSKPFAIVTPAPKFPFFQDLTRQLKVAEHDAIAIVTPHEFLNTSYVPYLVFWDISWRGKDINDNLQAASSYYNHLSDIHQIFINTFPTGLLDSVPEKFITVIDYEKDFLNEKNKTNN